MPKDVVRYIQSVDVGLDFVYIAVDGKAYQIKAEKYDELILEVARKLDALVGELNLEAIED